MESKTQEVLRKNLVYLVNNLEVEYILDTLFQESYIGRHTVEKIRYEPLSMD